MNVAAALLWVGTEQHNWLRTMFAGWAVASDVADANLQVSTGKARRYPGLLLRLQPLAALLANHWPHLRLSELELIFSAADAANAELELVARA